MGKSADLIKEYFSTNQDIEIKLNFNLKKYSTMRLKSQGDLFIVKKSDSLGKLTKFCFENKIQYLVLGMGANQLLKEKVELPIIKLDFELDENYLDELQKSYSLPASINLAKLSSHAIKFGMIGWEVFTGIPATLGGAVFMNAGTNLGEIGELVESVKYFTREGKKIEKIEVLVHLKK